MKRLFTSILLLFIITTFGFSNENLFSLISLNTFIEMKNLESIEDSWYFSGFEKSSKQNLKRVSVSLQSNDRNESYILFYNSKGIIEKEERDVFEKYIELYQYDEKDRLISCGDFSFRYIDDFQRERFFKGQLQYKETIEFQEDKILITVISYSKRYSDGLIIEMGKNVYEYNFKYGLLMDICCTNYNMKGVENKNKHYMKFLYNDDNLLQKAAEYYGNEIRNEQIFEYQNKNLKKRIVNYPSDFSMDFIAEYSDYDKHGNFVNYNKRNKNGIRLSFVRRIEYRDN